MESPVIYFFVFPTVSAYASIAIAGSKRETLLLCVLKGRMSQCGKNKG